MHRVQLILGRLSPGVTATHSRPGPAAPVTVALSAGNVRSSESSATCPASAGRRSGSTGTGPPQSHRGPLPLQETRTSCTPSLAQEVEGGVGGGKGLTGGGLADAAQRCRCAGSGLIQSKPEAHYRLYSSSPALTAHTLPTNTQAASSI